MLLLIFFYTNSIFNKLTRNKFLSLIISSCRFKLFDSNGAFIDYSIDFLYESGLGVHLQILEYDSQMLCLKKLSMVIHPSVA